MAGNSDQKTTQLPFAAIQDGYDFALLQVRPPLRLRKAARILLLLFVITALALLFVPWQQSLSTKGRVTAYDPTLREQVVESPITGRIIRIHVVEGQEVRGRKVDEDGNVIPGYKGTLLVSIRDQDPNLMKRLQEQRDALMLKLEAAEKRKKSLADQISALKNAKASALDVAKKRIEMSKKRENAAAELVKSNVAAYKLAEYQFQQQKKLLQDGLTSELEYQQSARQILATEAEKSRAQVLALEAGLSVLAFQADFDKVRHDFDASIGSAIASREKAITEAAGIQLDLAALDVRISRQVSQDVYAPCDGTVFRILSRSASGGALVKAGTPLLRIVPEIPEEQRVVELYVDGNDAPLITELWQEQLRKTGKKPEIPVRLQFEGYPAIQWVGWPSAAVGTFGGIIDFVDQTDDGKGSFRILVRRDPEEEETNPWPRGYALRQGVRAKGWVLLNRVTLGWEMWRRLNGFPPVVADAPAQTDKSKPAVLKWLKPK